MMLRKPVVLMLCFTVLAPIVLYTDKLGAFTTFSYKDGFVEEVSSLNIGGENRQLNVLPQESETILKEPIGVIYSDNSSSSLQNSADIRVSTEESREHKTRVLSTTDGNDSENENPIKEVTDGVSKENENADLEKTKSVEQNGNEEEKKDVVLEEKKDVVVEEKKDVIVEEKPSLSDQISSDVTDKKETNTRQQSTQTSGKVDNQESKNMDVMPDARVRHLRDQLIRARVYLGLGATRNNPHFIKDLRLRIKEVQKALGEASKDSELPRNANDKLKAMEQTLARGKQIQDDCAAIVKKLRAILHSTEEQLKVHKKQMTFLTQLAAKTLPKGLHCLTLRLATEYYSLSPIQQQFANQEKLEEPALYHYALFSDNVLAAAVVVNSTVSHAKEPANHVFHIVTDRLNYVAMRMWFLANPPGKATVQVQNVEEFTWLNSSYSPVLKQLGSPSMIDYYFKSNRANPDSNLKYRNPKYLSILNHLRFYLPEIFPKLNKVLFLDDDIVVQKDLTGLWSLNLQGKVIGAVETCGESFHRFNRYLNFSHPLISKNFDPHACGWAYGMNIFDLEEWKRQNITEVYHSWQRRNEGRQLWQLGTLPPGLITYYKRVFPLNRLWHVLGLGYNPNVNKKDIDRAAVIHYNGNMKPWLEIGMPKYRNYWAKFVDYNHIYLRECNINP